MNKKQIICAVTALALIVIGIVGIFVVVRKSAEKHLVVSLPCALSEKEFILATLPEDYFKETQFHGDSVLEYSTQVILATYDNNAFLNDVVYKSSSYVCDYVSPKEDLPDGKYFRSLFFFNGEYFALDINRNNEFQIFPICLFDTRVDSNNEIINYVFFWPGNEFFSSNETTLEFTWESFSNSYGNIICNNFDELSEFYGRIDPAYYEINNEEKTILLKGINTQTRIASNDYMLIIMATEEGFKAKRI